MTYDWQGLSAAETRCKRFPTRNSEIGTMRKGQKQ